MRKNRYTMRTTIEVRSMVKMETLCMITIRQRQESLEPGQGKRSLKKV
jgi:hypothetical protein